MYGPLHTFVLFWRWKCMDRHILYITTYTREQYDNFNLGYSQSAIHVVVLKHVGLIRVQTRIPANVQETELCCNTPQNSQSRMQQLQDLLDQGELLTWAGGLCRPSLVLFSMANPAMAIRSLVDLPACFPGLFGRQFTPSIGRSIVRRESPLLPSPLSPPSKQSQALTIHLVALHIFIRTTLHCVCNHKKLCCHPWIASK